MRGRMHNKMHRYKTTYFQDIKNWNKRRQRKHFRHPHLIDQLVIKNYKHTACMTEDCFLLRKADTIFSQHLTFRFFLFGERDEVMCWGTDADKVRLKCRNDSINGDKILWMHFLLFPKSEANGHFFPPPKHKEMQFIILSQSNNLFCNMNRTMFFTSSILTLFFFCLHVDREMSLWSFP